LRLRCALIQELMCSDLSSDAKNLLLVAKLLFGSTDSACRPLASNVSPLNVRTHYAAAVLEASEVHVRGSPERFRAPTTSLRKLRSAYEAR
jgi:hypothetical protein